MAHRCGRNGVSAVNFPENFILASGVIGAISEMVKDEKNKYSIDVMGRVLSFSKIFKMNEKVGKLLEMTDVDVCGIKLPFPQIFIDYRMKEFRTSDVVVDRKKLLKYMRSKSKSKKNKIDKLKTISVDITTEIYGIFVVEIPEVDNGIAVLVATANTFVATVPHEKTDYDDVISPCVLMFDNIDLVVSGDEVDGVMDRLWSERSIKPKPGQTVAMTHEGSYIVENDHHSRETRNMILNFITNFINFLDDPDIVLVEVPEIRGTGKYRKQTGKILYTAVRIKGKLKKYIDSLEKGSQIHYSHQFWVRGHWRELRSERFKKKRGKKVWIKPYVKGSGILVNKIYQVEE